MLAFGAAPTNQTMIWVLYLVAIVLLFYLMVFMPRKKQEKQHKELIANLAVRDRVATIGGIIGEIKKIKDNSVIIRTAENTELEMAKDAIARRLDQQ
ncbi:MAG: preprotein translocase subunit YajC [Methylocystaceae bacterium]